MGEEFDFEKFDALSKQLTAPKLQALGMPTSLSPAGLVTTFIRKLIPSIGKGLLGKIFGRLTGATRSGGGFFRTLGRTILRVIDAILGVIIGVIGGAILGAGGVGFAGLTGGLSGIARDPTTIHVNNRDQDNFVIHGDKAHEEKYGPNWNKGRSQNQNQDITPYRGQQYDQYGNLKPNVIPSHNEPNFID